MDTIPNPLESGQYTLDGGTFTGDVGSIDENTQPTVTLEHGATVNATTGSFSSLSGFDSDPRFSTFDVKQSDTLSINDGLGAGGGFETINVDRGGRLDLSVQQTFGDLTVNGGKGARVEDINGTIASGDASIQPAVIGRGTVTVTSVLLPADGAVLTLDSAVGKGETIQLDAGTLQLNDPMKFFGTLDWLPNGSEFSFDLGDDTSTVLAGISAQSYTLNDDTLILFKGHNDFLNIHLTNPTNAPLYVSEGTGGVVLSLLAPQYENTTPLPIHTGCA
jgi:hypothetical protein